MKDIHKIIKIIEESHYFKPWGSQLLSEDAVKKWNSILTEKRAEDLYKSIGEFCYAEGIPFVIVTEYIDEFFRHYRAADPLRYAIKNGISESYLHKKLDDDEHSLQQDIDKKLIGSLEKKRYLINAHLIWMRNFIKKIRGSEVELELDPCCCTVGKWLKSNSDSDKYPQVRKAHDNLHALALSALRMYEKNEYAYFLLLYLDIITDSYKIRDTIIHIYFIEHLCSIYEDPLTGLPNYLQLFQHLDHADGSRSLLVINIREFSKINIIYGQEKGNEIIKALAEYLKQNDEIETAYRIYADEFALTIPSIGRDGIIHRLKDEIEEMVFDIDGHEIVLRIYGSVGTKTKHILEHCEFGLIASKEHYGAIIDTDRMDKGEIRSYADKFTFGQHLRLAFLDKRIYPYLQPIMDLRSDTINRYEVLMRIEDESGTVMLPKEFLSTLKNMYIFPEITKFMIQRSFDLFKNESYDFSINITYADIVDENTRSFIAAIIKENPDTAKRCTFEILENEAAHNFDEVNSFFRFLHQYGLKIALDDFGIGYANYDTILNLDIDMIKIDGTLIKNIATDQKSRIMVESIVAIARTSNIEVVAEWVTDKETFNFVKDLGIDFAQGYYVGKPGATFVLDLFQGGQND
jgi:EAL domain-containing protein (putative c-di-GMP-specific phosphodiesterase class I)/GGDEF domain-containing protein